MYFEDLEKCTRQRGLRYYLIQNKNMDLTYKINTLNYL